MQKQTVSVSKNEHRTRNIKKYGSTALLQRCPKNFHLFLHLFEYYHLPLVIVSNEEFIEINSLFDPSLHDYYYSRFNVQLKGTIIDPKDLKGSISRMNTINNKMSTWTH